MERFTQRARRVLSLAHEEAERLHQSQIRTEHLLLSLIREEGGVAGQVLRDLGLNLAQVKRTIEALGGVGDHAGDRIELAAESEQVLKRAIEEARRMEHHYIGTEHMLLGIARQDKGLAMEILRRHGITPDQIRSQVERKLQGHPPQEIGGRSGS